MALIDELEPVKEAISNDNPELARNLLRLLIEEYPDSAEVWYQAAQVAVNERQRTAFLEKAVELDPLHHLAANELHHLQQPAQAVQIVEPPRYTPLPHYQPARATEHAPFWRRLLATLVDGFIIMVIAIVPMNIILWQIAPGLIPDVNVILNNHNMIIIAMIPYMIQAVYSGYFLSQQNGQTLGKIFLKIRVVKRDGTSITIWEAILRNVIGYQFSSMLFGLGFLWMFADKNAQTWHDLVSNTVVVDVP